MLTRYEVSSLPSFFFAPSFQLLVSSFNTVNLSFKKHETPTEPKEPFRFS